MSKERLVDLHVEAVAAWDTYLDMCEEQDVEPEKTFDEFVADYLIANGVIVPTYNIGQTVYAVAKGDDLWWKGTVASICCEFNEMAYGIIFDDGDFAMFEEECVFPSREEAEKELEKRDV